MAMWVGVVNGSGISIHIWNAWYGTGARLSRDVLLWKLYKDATKDIGVCMALGYKLRS